MKPEQNSEPIGSVPSAAENLPPVSAGPLPAESAAETPRRIDPILSPNGPTTDETAHRAVPLVDPRPDRTHRPSHHVHATPPRKKRSRAGLVLALMAVFALGYVGIEPRLRQNQKLNSEVHTLKASAPVVSYVLAKRAPDTSEIVLPSGLQAIVDTTINARTSGYVAARNVDIGSKVHKGELLAVIQSPEVDEQLSQSQADIAKSQAGLGQAEADASRLQAGISTSRSIVSESKTQVLQTEADLAHLKAKALQAQAAVSVDKARLQASLKQLAGARADLSRAHVDEAIAKVTLNRWRQLEKADAVAGQDVDEKQSDWESSQARVDAASAAVSTAQADVEAAQETVRSAQAEVLAAQADVQSGTQRVRSAESTVQANQSNVQAAISGYTASRSSVEAARAAISSSQANYRRVAALQSFENIVAPFSGVITARNVDVGDLVNATGSGSGASNPLSTVTKTGLFGLAQTDVLRAEVSVPEDDVTAIHGGQAADITLMELPGQKFQGHVFNVSGALDTASRTELVEVRIPNPNGTLKPGMYAQIHFVGSRGQAVVQVPGNAVMFDDRGTRVAIVRPDGTLHYLAVKVGRDFGNTIDIRDGLQGDEKVVTNPDESIPDGAKVTARADTL